LLFSDCISFEISGCYYRLPANKLFTFYEWQFEVDYFYNYLSEKICSLIC
jgi:hypothetical protein